MYTSQQFPTQTSFGKYNLDSIRDKENTITNITLKSATKKSMMPLKSKKKMRSTSKSNTVQMSSVPAVA